MSLSTKDTRVRRSSIVPSAAARLSRCAAASLFLFSAGCKRTKTSPLLSTPASGTSSVTLAVRAIDPTENPNIKAVMQVLSNGSQGAPITDFQLGNFSILEDGKPGVPFEVGPEIDPVISVGIVLDRSGTMMGTSTDFANAGATALVNALTGNDRAALIEFESTARVVVPFTGDKASLLAEINQPAEGGSTAYYDGITFAANELVNEKGIKIMIFLSDGDPDNSSSGTEADMVSAISGYGMTIFGIVVGSNLGGTNQYLAATNATGGQLYFAPIGTGLESTFLGILNSPLYQNLVYMKFRKRSNAEKYDVFLNYGSIMAQTEIKVPAG